MSVFLLAACLLVEAEGETLRGIEMVADTVANRAIIRNLTVEEVVLTTGYCGVNVAVEEIHIRAERSPEIWNDCKRIALRLIRGTWEPTTPYTDFYNPDKVTRTPKHALLWTKSEKFGNHLFGVQ